MASWVLPIHCVVSEAPYLLHNLGRHEQVGQALGRQAFGSTANIRSIDPLNVGHKPVNVMRDKLASISGSNNVLQVV